MLSALLAFLLFAATLLVGMVPTQTPEPTATLIPLPTATLEPLPTEKPYEPQATTVTTQGTVEAIICSFAWSCKEALEVAYCESKFLPYVENGIHRGIFQISRTFHEWRFLVRGWTWNDAFDPFKNVAIAFEIWSESHWSLWSCKPT